ncbi:hypothetical protein GWK47_004472 [Chionoecetes opilio]|uniref:Uncharacterized protein n=1 Tax=Chionoecetes opilio TaxID=41210 RepID=A0A8J5CYQ0_CHIOP|nr:hypothetical protein GWK47_004472 [Chionoecetes opilio]
MEENKNPRKGRLCYVQSTHASSKGLQTLIHHSFSHIGVRLFNCAPRHIRDLTGVTTDTFKHHLDKWLADIPDHPPTPGYSSSHDNTLPSVVLEARNRELHTTPGMIDSDNDSEVPVAFKQQAGTSITTQKLRQTKVPTRK